MNVVLARGSKTENSIENAKIIAAKLGFTTEYIVTQSWNCQVKYQKFEYDPYRNAWVIDDLPVLHVWSLKLSNARLHSPLPSDPNQDCVMNLPVCDLSDIRECHISPFYSHNLCKSRITNLRKNNHRNWESSSWETSFNNQGLPSPRRTTNLIFSSTFIVFDSGLPVDPT